MEKEGKCRKGQIKDDKDVMMAWQEERRGEGNKTCPRLNEGEERKAKVQGDEAETREEDETSGGQLSLVDWNLPPSPLPFFIFDRRLVSPPRASLFKAAAPRPPSITSLLLSCSSS